MFSKNEKYFDFSKMDKKNVQNWVVKNVLTDRFFLFCIYIFMVRNVIVKNLFMIVKFYIFFAEKDLGVF